MSSGIVMTRAQAAAIVKDPHEAQAEAIASFEPVYESESEFQEARRQLTQRCASSLMKTSRNFWATYFPD